MGKGSFLIYPRYNGFFGSSVGIFGGLGIPLIKVMDSGVSFDFVLLAQWSMNCAIDFGQADRRSCFLQSISGFLISWSKSLAVATPRSEEFNEHVGVFL